MNKKRVFVIISQSQYSTGCDYALQTAKFLLRKKQKVIFVLFGEPFKWRDFFSKNKNIFSRKENLLVFRPFFLVIGNHFRCIRKINSFLNSLFLNLYVNSLYREHKKYLWLFEPDYATIFSFIFSKFFKIYDCVDFFPFFSEYSKKCHLKLLKTADLVTANSNVIFDEISQKRTDAKLVPLGFAEDIFKKNISLPKKITDELKKFDNKFVLGFVGGISSRINFSFLKKVVFALPDVDFVFFGNPEPAVFGQKDALQQKVALMQKYKNFHLFPPVKKELIPALLKKFNVGLIPYNVKNLYNRYSFPMKSMEYLYVGLPTISSGIEELKRFPKFISVTNEVKEFIKIVRRLQKRQPNAKQQKEMKKLAISHSWESKLDKILQEVEMYL